MALLNQVYRLIQTTQDRLIQTTLPPAQVAEPSPLEAETCQSQLSVGWLGPSAKQLWDLTIWGGQTLITFFFFFKGTGLSLPF